MAGQQRLGPLELLRQEPRFRRLWYAQIVSELGDWFQIVALLTLLPTGHGKSHVAAGYLVLRLVPTIVWAPFAGVVADRVDRGKVLVACDLLRAAIVLAYPWVIRADGTTNVVLLYSLSFAQESLSAFFEPARGAVLPQIVPTRGLLSANALSGATWSAMLALGAFLGGLATRSIGRNGAYVIDAFSFLLSAAFVLAARLPKLPKDAPREPHAPEVSALREGASYLRTHPAQAMAACLKGGWGLVGGIAVLFTAFADQVFTVGNAAAAASAMGLLYCGRGLGALVGPFVARRFAGETIAGLSRAVLISFPVAAIGYFAFGLAPSVWLAAAALVLAHCGGSTVWVHSTQLLQLSVPNRLLGRVFAVEWAGLTAAMCVSTLAVSALLDLAHWTPRQAAFAVGAVPLLVAALWATVRRRVRLQLEADARTIAEAEHGP
jgi:MFS family permease